jgi:hypothetical protein
LEAYVSEGARPSTAANNSPGTLRQLAAKGVAALSVLGGRAAVLAGLRRAPEGWRRTVGILLRSEPTRFALSAFGLRVPSIVSASAGPGTTGEDRVARGLLLHLANEPDAHFSLESNRFVTIRRRTSVADVVVLRFSSDGRLEGLRPWLAGAGPPAADADAHDRVHHAIIAAYNRTAGLEEIERPQRLLADVRQRIPPAELGYARRVLSACCLSFETRDLADPAARFAPPRFSGRRTLGFGYLSWIARLDSAGDAVDLWVSAHHVGLDGVPLQDLLGRLERAWGTAAHVPFPPATRGTAFFGPHPCHVTGERPVDLLTTFVDLAPVQALRRDLSARLADAVGGEVTLGTLMAWLLSQEPEFSGVRVASTVDVAASGGYERDVDVVSLRPADYVTGPGPWDGLAPFAREFNRLIAACRTRTSPVRTGMQTAGLLPPWAHATLVRSAPASLDDTFGTLCITIIRDAKVFIAPMTDLGLGLGFFAIGSAALPSADGGTVTSVSVKGDAGRIAHYPAILQRAIDRAASLEVY